MYSFSPFFVLACSTPLPLLKSKTANWLLITMLRKKNAEILETMSYKLYDKFLMFLYARIALSFSNHLKRFSK